ncbi:MAG TPA: glycosyltransferase family 39 protein, partial [Bryobacteraceae bacterium]
MTVRKRQPTPKPQAIRESLPAQLLRVIERRALWIATVLSVLASARIVATYSVFNHTYDEPAHVACGMEWLDQGLYRWEPQHPPLARVAAAFPLYVAGLRSHNTQRDIPFAMWQEGAAILYSGDLYDRNLVLARLGILPFFWLTCAVVYAWGARYFRPAVAVAAVFLFSMLPPVLAHAGLATTDMALTATMALAFFAGMVWLERPSLFHAAWFGVATGVMMLSKFSALVFFPASAVLALIWYLVTERPGRLADAVKARALSFGLAVLTGALIIWAGYRFSFGDVGFLHLRLPAPELYAGIRQVIEHNALGQDSYLLGTYNRTGFWLFFPVAL